MHLNRSKLCLFKRTIASGIKSFVVLFELTLGCLKSERSQGVFGRQPKTLWKIKLYEERKYWIWCVCNAMYITVYTTMNQRCLVVSGFCPVVTAWELAGLHPLGYLRWDRAFYSALQVLLTSLHKQLAYRGESLTTDVSSVVSTWLV